MVGLYLGGYGRAVLVDMVGMYHGYGVGDIMD